MFEIGVELNQFNWWRFIGICKMTNDEFADVKIISWCRIVAILNFRFLLGQKLVLIRKIITTQSIWFSIESDLFIGIIRMDYFSITCNYCIANLSSTYFGNYNTISFNGHPHGDTWNTKNIHPNHVYRVKNIDIIWPHSSRHLFGWIKIIRFYNASQT